MRTPWGFFSLQFANVRKICTENDFLQKYFVHLTSETTLEMNGANAEQLWIAFKNLYLWHRKQPIASIFLSFHRCELLSKICIFDIGNNVIFAESSLSELWIAFKNLYLWHRKQPSAIQPCYLLCCELLSKICIFDIGNNIADICTNASKVVNCFQKFVSLTSETTVWL